HPSGNERHESNVEGPQDVPELLTRYRNRCQAHEVNSHKRHQHEQLTPLLHVTYEYARIVDDDRSDRTEMPHEEACHWAVARRAPPAGCGGRVAAAYPTAGVSEPGEHPGQEQARQ